MDEEKIPLALHLIELRKRIFSILLGLIPALCLAFLFVDDVILFLQKPMLAIMPANARLVVLSPHEYFFTELKAAIFLGLILASPWTFIQIWRFVAPGLYRHEKRLLFAFVLGASSCFLAGIFFAYYFVFPPTFRFFLDTLPPGIEGAYSVGMLYGFALMLLCAFGIIFQTPVAVFLLIMLDIVSVETLTSYRRYIFLAAFIVGAILTPPDPITQTMLALPAYALFEMGLLAARLVKRKSRES
jgi:sec-independent protein translocase protein TatC